MEKEPEPIDVPRNVKDLDEMITVCDDSGKPLPDYEVDNWEEDPVQAEPFDYNMFDLGLQDFVDSLPGGPKAKKSEPKQEKPS